MNYQEIIQFWFDDTEPQQWFQTDIAFDKKIKSKFSSIHTQVSLGETYTWRKTIAGRLAEVIVLDQFSRNLFRGAARAFSYDGMALILAQEAIASGELNQLPTLQRAFIYMPFMHSESLLIHREALKLFSEAGLEEMYHFEERHYDILIRFGRYPHRNAILGRTSTKKELAFLKEPNSSF